MEPLQPPPPDAQLFSVHEGLNVRLQPAPLLKRMLAYAVDMAIVSIAMQIALVPIIIVFSIGGVAVAKILKDSAQGVEGSLILVAIMVAALLLLMLVGAHGYFIWFEKKKAQTPGKKLFGLKVISLDGGNLTWGQCSSREFFRYIDGFLLLPGLIAVLLNDRRQRIGDMASGTMVTHSSKSEARDDFTYVTPDEFELMKLDWPISDIPDPAVDRFLAFAYRTYVLREPDANTLSDAEIWARDLKTCLAPGAVLPTDDTKFLRYCAEICFQKKRNS